MLKIEIRTTAIIITAWLAFGLAAAGISNAQLQADHYDWGSPDKCARWATRDRSYSVILGMVGGPFALIASLALTGFAYDGWNLSLDGCIRKHQ